MNLNPEAQNTVDSIIAETPAEEVDAASEGEAKATAADLFNPVDFVCEELQRAGSDKPTCWMAHLDPRSETEPDELARIFFVNRSLRLYMSEQEGRNHNEARLLLADGISVSDWKSIVSKGVVPWILNKLPVNKKQLAAASAAVSEHRAVEATAVVEQEAQQPAAAEDASMNSLESVQE